MENPPQVALFDEVPFKLRGYFEHVIASGAQDLAMAHSLGQQFLADAFKPFGGGPQARVLPCRCLMIQQMLEGIDDADE